MYASTLSMLGHSLAAWLAGELRQSLTSAYQVAIGTGSELRLVLGADTNFTLGLPTLRRPTVHRFAVRPSNREKGPQDCLGLPFGTALDSA